MSLEYSRSALRIVVAQICQNLGWNSINSTPLELLTDVMERYLLQLAKLSHRYSEQFGLTDPRLEDVGLALTHMGVSLTELEDYVRHVDPLVFPKEVIAFPAPKANDLKFPNPDSKEVQQRKVFEFVPEHLPYMHPELNEDTEDSNPPPAPPSPERLQVEQQPQTAELSPGLGEKRPISSPGDSNLPFKRPRLTTSALPDEASHSQYEMTSVVMTNSGILSPVRQGKIPDARTPPVAKQIIIVKSASAAPKGPGVAPTPGMPISTDTPIIKLDFTTDPVNGQSKIVEVDGEQDSGTQVNFDKSDPEYNPKKKKMREKNKLGQPVKIKRGPGRPKSPGRAPLVIHKASDIEKDIIKMLTTARKDDSLGRLDATNQPMDLSVKPTPAPPNISVRLDESLRAKPKEYKQKIATMSTEQEKDMEDTIASVIQRSMRDSEQSDDNEGNAPQSVIYREGSLPHKSVKKDSESNSDNVWRVKSISETFTDDNAHDPYDIDRSEGMLSPVQQFIAPHLRLLQDSPKRPRGRPRGSGSGIYRGLMSRGTRKPGRPPLNRSPGRPPISRSPGRPPLNRSPGRPPGSGRSPGRPKGSLNKTHSPKPRGRPRGSKSPRSRGSSPRGLSPRGAIQNINFDVNAMTESITKPYKDKEDSNDSEATNFEFPTHSDESDTDKKSVELELDKDRKNFQLSDNEASSPKRITPAPSPLLSPKRSSREGSTEPENEKKEQSPIKTADITRDKSVELSDHEVREKLQDSEDDSRKTANYGDIDNQSRHSDERESSAESVYKKEKSLEREKRPSSRESTYKDSTSDKEQRKGSEERESIPDRHFSKERSYSKEKEKIYSQERERSSSKEQARSVSKEKEIKLEILEEEERETSIERDYKQSLLQREYKEASLEQTQKESSLERDYSKERESKERSKEREYKERSKEREQKEHSKEREHKEHSKERDHKERSKERDHKEHRKDKDREHKEHGKEREHKEHSKERDHKERSKERDHKEHRKDKEHKKDKKKKKKKDKDKDRDRERDKDDRREKKEKHKLKEKETREESPSVQPLVQKLKIKFGGASASSPGSFSISASTTPSSPARESMSPRPEIPKLVEKVKEMQSELDVDTNHLPPFEKLPKFKVLPPKPDAAGADRDKTDPQTQSWTSSVKEEVERVPTPKAATPKHEPSPARSLEKVKSEPADDSDHEACKTHGDSDKDVNNSADGETEVTISVIGGKVTGIGGAKKPGKRGKRKGSAKKGKAKIPKLSSTPATVSATPETKVLPLKKALDKASSESPSHLFSMENVPSPITIPALKAAPPPPSPPANKKSPPKPKPLLKDKDVKPPSPLVKEVPTKIKPPPVTIPKPAKISKSPRRSSPRKSPKISPPIRKKGSAISTPSSKSPSPKPSSPTKSTPFDFTAPRTPSPTPHSTPSHSAPSSPMYSPASSPSRDSLSFQIPPTPAFRPRTSPSLSPPSRQISTDDEKEDTPPTSAKPRMPPPSLPPMPPTSASAMRRQQRSVVVETIGSFVNESGEKIWICPACTLQDDGSPMVGCDSCDDWYHWACVGIMEEPTEEAWYCTKCKPSKTQQKKRGRKKKK